MITLFIGINVLRLCKIYSSWPTSRLNTRTYSLIYYKGPLIIMPHHRIRITVSRRQVHYGRRSANNVVLWQALLGEPLSFVPFLGSLHRPFLQDISEWQTLFSTIIPGCVRIPLKILTLSSSNILASHQRRYLVNWQAHSYAFVASSDWYTCGRCHRYAGRVEFYDSDPDIELLINLLSPVHVSNLPGTLCRLTTSCFLK